MTLSKICNGAFCENSLRLLTENHLHKNPSQRALDMVLNTPREIIFPSRHLPAQS